MEHARCGQCRNPVRGRQAHILHARSGITFHTDCWGELHRSVQESYAEQSRSAGIDVLLTPYSRTELGTWLPQSAIDDAVETLSGQLEVDAFHAGVESELRPRD